MVTLVNRKQERKWPDQMWSNPPENLPSPARLCHESEGVLFQIPESAMDEFGGPAGGSTGEIGLIDKRDPQSAQGRIAGYARAENPAADNQQVERTVGEGDEISIHAVCAEDISNETPACLAEKSLIPCWPPLYSAPKMVVILCSRLAGLAL